MFLVHPESPVDGDLRALNSLGLCRCRRRTRHRTRRNSRGARRCRCAQARVLAHGQVAPPATMLHAHHLCNALRRVAQRGLVESTHKWRALAARSNTDRPRASVTIMLAPTPRSACATVSAPFFKTMCSGVWPRLFIESAMAPAARSSLTTSTWPRRARAAG